MNNEPMRKIQMILIALMMTSASAENIDPQNIDSQYAYGENIGWLNFEPSEGPGVHVSADKVEGFIWAENIGWINLSPTNYGGVVNNGSGNLSGYAWGENIGWINFGPPHGGVTIDVEGNFEGWAWGENIGWISFDSSRTYNVRACTVTFDDLQSLASQWLDDADNYDFARLAQYWLDFCPDGWRLEPQ
ncbi:MAG: hypothetical protein JSU70_12070 [Phycisphaerales bacterium]|nr:MAG: hypothetical protein JSU70_12070 [Phycisphaerales bacterium]